VVFTFQNAMAIGFLYSVLVFILTVVPIGCKDGEIMTMREKLFDGIPPCVRKAIGCGIGLFITFIGLQDADVVSDNQWTLVQHTKWQNLFNDATRYDPGTGADLRVPAKHSIVCMISFVAMGVLEHLRVPGGVIIGMLLGTIIGIPMNVSKTNVIAGKGVVPWSFWDSWRNFFKEPAQGGSFAACFRSGGFKFPKGSGATIVMLVISLGMVDLFDTMGTVVGCATKADLVEEDGKPKGYGGTIFADSTAALAAYLLGSSSVTTYVESGTGIAAGGKTGLVALVVAVLFLLSLFFAPIFAFVPGAAAGAALIYVGVLMMSTVGDVDFTDLTQAIPAFLTIVMMPFCFSITDGIGLGMLSYVLIQLIVWCVAFVKSLVQGTEKPEWTISVITGIVAVLFVVYFFVPMQY
jgi:AGZA family xanthine/uracil permease-like MFS transporter